MEMTDVVGPFDYALIAPIRYERVFNISKLSTLARWAKINGFEQTALPEGVECVCVPAPDTRKRTMLHRCTKGPTVSMRVAGCNAGMV